MRHSCPFPHGVEQQANPTLGRLRFVCEGEVITTFTQGGSQGRIACDTAEAKRSVMRLTRRYRGDEAQCGAHLRLRGVGKKVLP